jgi:outer membrane receptor protein involved in Fe transport
MRLLSGCVLALLAALVVVPGALAQETTGALVGVVRDSEGAVLPGATVEAVGPVGRVTAVTDGRGEYRLPRLPSGRYTVNVAIQGFAPASIPAEIVVGSTVTVDFTLSLAGITETVEVSAQSSAVDLSSSSTSTSISRERIEYVPRGRDFTSVVTQAAGATDEPQASGISIDGASGAENRFIVDGIDTTDPQVGTSSLPLRAEFLEEVQVKSAGYSAEFGGSTGGVINVITKSGTNDFRGTVLSDFQQRSWGGKQRPLLRESLEANTFVYVQPPKDEETRIDPGVSLGGPIWRGRLWFFGTYQPGIRTTERTVNFTNGVTNTLDQDFRVNYGSFNVTGNAGSKLLFRGGANFAPAETKRTLPPQDGRTSLTDQSDYLRGTELDRRTFSGSVDYVPNSQLVVSARVGRMLTDRESTGVTFPELIHNFSTASTPDGLAALPAEFRRQSGFLSDILVTDATAFDQYTRDYIGLDTTVFFSAAGRHELKAGVQTERIGNEVQQGYNGDRILYYAGRTYTTTTGQVSSGPLGYFRLLNISTIGDVRTRNTALFIQDSWAVTSRLTLNLGLRTEHEKIPNYGTVGGTSPIDFGFGDKLAPRLGFAYDVLGDGKWKAYGSFGKYFDVMKYELPRGSFGGDKWVDYFYTWDNPNWQLNGGGCATGSNTVGERPTCGAGALIEAVDRRHNAADPDDSTVDPNLKPMEENEFQFGLTRELSPRFVVGARYVFKDLVRTIEDVGILVPGIGEVYYIANPGEGITLELADPGVPNFPKAERQYQGLELTAEKRFSNNWSLFGSYTLSRLHGNYSGLASSSEHNTVGGGGRLSPNVARYFDHIEQTFDRNGQLVYGRLGTDRPHQFKGQGTYRFNTNTLLGVNQYVASGVPVSEEGRVPIGVPFYPYGRGNLGRTPVLSQTDLLVSQDFRFGGRYGFQVQATILNLFDQDTVTRRWPVRMVSDLPVPGTGNTAQRFFAGGWDYESILAGQPNLQDVRYNQADVFQAPREIRLTVKFSF